MTFARRYWWVLPAVLAGAYWIFRAFYDNRPGELLILGGIVAVAVVLYYALRRR